MSSWIIVILDLAMVAAFVSLGSYYIHHWFAGSGVRSVLPWFVSGLALVVIAGSVGFAITELLSRGSITQGDGVDAALIGSPNNEHADGKRVRSEPAHKALTSPPRVPRRLSSELRVERMATSDAAAARLSPSQTSTERQLADERAPVSEAARISREAWVADLTFWGATRCVLALHLDPEDPGTWTLINDCGVDVRILVATCAGAPEECWQRRSTSWSYVLGGLPLPAKVKRSVALEEQTVRGLHLRYVACRSTIVVDSQLPESGALRQVGVQSCDEEVRSLARIGSQSGWAIEELVNEPVPMNACCSEPKE